LADIYPEKYLKKLTGNTEIEDALQELDKLTQEEARMATAELLKIAHSIDGNVMGVDDRVKGVDGRVKGVDERVQEVGGDVQDVGKKVEDVDDRMQDIGGDVKDMSNKVQDVHDEVQGIDDKLEEVNRSSSLTFPLLRSGHPDTSTGNQLRDSLLRWLSPPDPSINHNIARKAHHNGTAQWFFQGGIFNQWKTTGSFLWLHGKRAFLHPFTV